MHRFKKIGGMFKNIKSWVPFNQQGGLSWWNFGQNKAFQTSGGIFQNTKNLLIQFVLPLRVF